MTTPRLALWTTTATLLLGVPAALEGQHSENRAYLTILCQFADWADTQLRDRSYYERIFQGAEYPSFQHYWSENANGQLTFSGSRMIGWVTLPEPRDAYYPHRRPDGSVNHDAPDFRKLLTECTALVDGDVDFREFAGVNIALNGVNSISHGTTVPIELDGQVY